MASSDSSADPLSSPLTSNVGDYSSMQQQIASPPHPPRQSKIALITELICSLTKLERLVLLLQITPIIQQDSNLLHSSETNVKCSTSGGGAGAGGGNPTPNPSILQTDPLNFMDFKTCVNPLGNRAEIQLTINWIRTHMEEDPQVSMPKHEVYDEYIEYCSDQNMRSLSTADFGKVMKQVYPNVRPRRLGTRGNSRYCYAGLKRRVDLDEPITPDISAATDSTLSPMNEMRIQSMNDSTLTKRKDIIENDGCENIIDSSSICGVILKWAHSFLSSSNSISPPTPTPPQFHSLQDLADFILQKLFIDTQCYEAKTYLHWKNSNKRSQVEKETKKKKKKSPSIINHFLTGSTFGMTTTTTTGNTSMGTARRESAPPDVGGSNFNSSSNVGEISSSSMKSEEESEQQNVYNSTNNSFQFPNCQKNTSSLNMINCENYHQIMSSSSSRPSINSAFSTSNTTPSSSSIIHSTSSISTSAPLPSLNQNMSPLIFKSSNVTASQHLISRLNNDDNDDERRRVLNRGMKRMRVSERGGGEGINFNPEVSSSNPPSPSMNVDQPRRMRRNNATSDAIVSDDHFIERGDSEKEVERVEGMLLSSNQLIHSIEHHDSQPTHSFQNNILTASMDGLCETGSERNIPSTSNNVSMNDFDDEIDERNKLNTFRQLFVEASKEKTATTTVTAIKEDYGSESTSIFIHAPPPSSSSVYAVESPTTSTLLISSDATCEEIGGGGISPSVSPFTSPRCNTPFQHLHQTNPMQLNNQSSSRFRHTSSGHLQIHPSSISSHNPSPSNAGPGGVWSNGGMMGNVGCGLGLVGSNQIIGNAMQNTPYDVSGGIGSGVVSGIIAPLDTVSRVATHGSQESINLIGGGTTDRCFIGGGNVNNSNSNNNRLRHHSAQARLCNRSRHSSGLRFAKFSPMAMTNLNNPYSPQPVSPLPQQQQQLPSSSCNMNNQQIWNFNQTSALQTGDLYFESSCQGHGQGQQEHQIHSQFSSNCHVIQEQGGGVEDDNPHPHGVNMNIFNNSSMKSNSTNLQNNEVSICVIDEDGNDSQETQMQSNQCSNLFFNPSVVSPHSPIDPIMNAVNPSAVLSTHHHPSSYDGVKGGVEGLVRIVGSSNPQSTNVGGGGGDTHTEQDYEMALNALKECAANGSIPNFSNTNTQHQHFQMKE